MTFSDKSVSVDKVSKYYQVPYAQQPLDLQRVTVPANDPGVLAMHLPAPNEFIAEDVSLVTLPENPPAVPQVALASERQKIWFMPDTEFRVPRGITYINFRSPDVVQTAEQAALVSLYTELLTDQVNEFAYPANLAGMSFDFYKHLEGISLRVSGYNDKQSLLLQRLLQGMVKPQFSQRRFDDIRTDMIRSLQNSVAKRPSSQVIDDLNEALVYGEWGEHALIAALQNIDLATLNEYIRQFWADATAEVLIYGNYNADEVQQVSTMLASVVSDRARAGPARKQGIETGRRGVPAIPGRRATRRFRGGLVPAGRGR